jgi:hypothetical protein
MAKHLTENDFERLSKKDLARTLKHFNDFERKYPESFKKFIGESFTSRTLKLISSYLT